MNAGFFRSIVDRFGGIAPDSLANSIRRAPAVGIDIGSHSVKAVALKRRNGGIEAVAGEAFYTAPFAGGSSRAVIEPLLFLAGDFGLKGAAAAVSVPGDAVFAGGIPSGGGRADGGTPDGETPEEAVAARMRELFPEGTGGMVSGFCENGGGLLMAAAKTSAVRERAAALRACGIVPKVADYEGFAVINSHLRGRAEDEGGGAVVLLNIGRRTVNLAVVDGGEVLLTKDLPRGCGEATALIAQAGDLTEEEAEMEKMRLGADSRREFKDAAREVSLKLAHEVKATLEAFDLLRRPPGAVEISGGGALLHGLAGVLEETLEAGVKLADPLKGLCDETPEVSAKCAVATGLALRVV